MATAALVPIPRRSTDVTVRVRKHVPGCKNTSGEKLKKCTCPKYLYIKATQEVRSARTRSWNVADALAQKIRDSYNPDKARIAELEAKQAQTRVLLDEAVEVWLNHKRADEVDDISIRHYRYTLRKFVDFARSSGVNYLHEVTPPVVTNWKTQIATEHRSTQRKKRGHLRDFFGFCVENQKWIAPGDNPATALTRIRGRDDISAVPFSQAQYDAIIAATYKYQASLKTYNRKECENAETRLRTFIETMRWSGLAIIDTTLLAKASLKPDDSLVLKRFKTGEPVVVLLPHDIAEALRKLPPGQAAHPDYFFWSRKGKERNASGIWHRAFERLWKLVEWPTPLVALADGEQPGDGTGDPIKPHPHMFRHMFAAHALQHGMSVPDVARLLGQRSTATTLRYYHNFVPEEAERLKEKVRAMYAAHGAPGYKKPKSGAKPHARRA